MNPKPFLQTHARKLDLHLYEYIFEGASSQPVLDELATYQDADGGFGHALEPDLRLPHSSVLATVVAFQYLFQLDIDADNELVKQGIRYLMNSYEPAKNSWTNIPTEADDFPRAAWWNYKSTLEWAEWGNPSAEVLGYLLKYSKVVEDDELLEKLSQKAIEHLIGMKESEPHEVKCYIRLYKNAGKELQAQLHDPLAKHIAQAAEVNSDKWGGYTATPLTFIDAPDAPFAELFDKALLQENVAYLKKQMIDGTHWLPTWEWGQYEDEWVKARVEWSGKLTVENFKLLNEFDV